jgi:hypothetical protein
MYAWYRLFRDFSPFRAQFDHGMHDIDVCEAITAMYVATTSRHLSENSISKLPSQAFSGLPLLQFLYVCSTSSRALCVHIGACTSIAKLKTRVTHKDVM